MDRPPLLRSVSSVWKASELHFMLVYLKYQFGHAVVSSWPCCGVQLFGQLLADMLLWRGLVGGVSLYNQLTLSEGDDPLQ